MALEFPESDAVADSELRIFVEQVINRQNSYRLRQLHRMAIAHWNYKGEQLLRRPATLTGNETAGYRFERVSTPGGVEPSVDNYIASYVDNETARLVRRQVEPRMDARSDDDDLRSAAQLAKLVLDWDCEENHWPDLYRELVNGFARVGFGALVTSVDELLGDLRRVPCEGAAMCPMCGARFASTQISEPAAMSHVLQSGAADVMAGQAMLTRCPMHEPGDQPDLQPYEPTIEEIQSGQDMFGAEFGADKPRVRPMIDVAWWWELYPENGGRRVRPRDMRVWGRRRVQEIEWIAERFPEVLDSQGNIVLEPDAHTETLKGDPETDYMVDGVWSLTGLGARDADTYPHHAVVEEVHVGPRSGLPDGISIYVLGHGQRIVARRPYIRRVQAPDGREVKVERAKLHTAHQKLDPGNFWGASRVVDMLSVQWRLNRLDMQVEDIRIKGSPQVVLEPGDEIERRDDVSGSLAVFEATFQRPGVKLQDRIMNAVPLTGNVYMEERAQVIAALQRLGATGLELGQLTTKYTATQVAIAQAEIKQQREEAETALDEACKSAWEHVLAIRWAYQDHYDEIPQSVVSRLAKGQDQLDAFRGADLLGQTEVTVEVVAGFDHTVQEREDAKQMKDGGLYDLTTQEARDQYIDLMGAPKIDAAKSVQVERATDAWQAFLRDRSVAVLDETTHDALIWYEVLGSKWLSEEGREIQRRAGWEQVLRQIAGWERRLAQISAQDAAMRDLYEGQDRSAWPQIQELAQQQKAITADAQSKATGVEVMPEPVPAPPTGDFLPQLLADRILVVWSSMVQENEPVLTPEVQAAQAERAKLLAFYALIQHARLASQAAAAMMAPPPAPSVPGAQAPVAAEQTAELAA